MKFTRLAPIFAFLALAAAHGQQQPSAEDLNLDFGLDEYIYEPKFTFSLGMRGMGGPKSSFGGSGVISSTQQIGELDGSKTTRYYHDGTVGTDSRRDLNGNLVPSDGYTNSWTFLDDKQVRDDGFLEMHTYSAQVQDRGRFTQDPKSSYGVEIAVSRDMGKLFGKLPWSIVAGVSGNDLRASFRSAMSATITTVTDTYYLGGITPPKAPYTAPASYTDADGNTFDSALLGDTPLTRETTTSTSDVSVTNSWKLRGAYYTMRAGPSLSIPITQNLKATLGVGAVLIYAGSTYTVDQVFQPETSDAIVNTVSDGASDFLPGFYVDGTVEYTFTDRTGVYVGGVYQHAGTYDQTIVSGDSRYTTRVDMSSMQGLRAGMTFRF